MRLRMTLQHYWQGHLSFIMPGIGELLDEALAPELHERIGQLAEKAEGVLFVEKCYSRKMETAYHVDLHIWVNGDISVEIGHDIAHKVKNEILKNVPQVIDVHIHVEPS